MGLQVGGMMSGLDTQGIVSKLMELERRPIELLEKQEDAFKLKLTAYGSIRSVLSKLKNAVKDLYRSNDFAGTTATTSNEDIVGVSSSIGARLGSHAVVVNSLAQAHAVRSGAFTSEDDVVGTGTLSIQIGTEDPVEVAIDSSHETLSGIAQAINDADAGVTASVVDDGQGNVYLSLMSQKTGAANTISVTISDGGTGQLTGLYDSGAMVTTQEGLNSQLTVDGIDIERSGNSIDDLIAGVTLTLNKADQTSPVNVNVSRDLDSIKDKLSAFVDAYNAVVNEFNAKQAYGGEEGTSGALIGDAAVRSIGRRMSGILGKVVEGTSSMYKTLASVGISMDRYGKLSLDAEDLETAIDDDLEGVTSLFTADEEAVQGVGTALYDYLDDTLRSSDGTIAAREKGLQESIDNIEDKKERMEDLVAKREETLWNQFNSLELLLSGYQQTSDYLAQQIKALAALNQK